MCHYCFVVRNHQHIQKYCIQLCLDTSLIPMIQEKNLKYIPTFIVNPCDHVAFVRKTGVYMTEINFGIDVCFKNIRYCLIIWRISTKSNLQWSIDSCQFSIFRISVNFTELFFDTGCLSIIVNN